MMEEVVVSTPTSVDGEESTQSAIIAEKVAEILRGSGYPELQRVLCQCREGAVILQGHVSSFYMKQLAQALAIKIPDVDVIANCLRVDDVSGDVRTAIGSRAWRQCNEERSQRCH